MDLKLLFLINQAWTGPVRDRVMALLSSFDAWMPLLALLIAGMLWRGGFRARSLVVCAALIAGMNDGVISYSIKHLVNRPRPRNSVDGVREVDLARARPRLLAVFQPPRVTIADVPADQAATGGHSFPSSHTINTISLALLVACYYRRYGWLAFLPALGVGYSRIYVGAHWPTDVLASIFLGLGTTLVLFAILEWLWKIAGEKWWPQFRARHPSLVSA
jgi:undecaprenyl-diphosphatase